MGRAETEPERAHADGLVGDAGPANARQARGALLERRVARVLHGHAGPLHIATRAYDEVVERAEGVVARVDPRRGLVHDARLQDQVPDRAVVAGQREERHARGGGGRERRVEAVEGVEDAMAQQPRDVRCGC